MMIFTEMSKKFSGSRVLAMAVEGARRAEGDIIGNGRNRKSVFAKSFGMGIENFSQKQFFDFDHSR